ncbi:MAG: glycosyltransferase family 4 protein [Pseudomonadota bacterium]|nr:glycosyltransferase family 4 protein [Pseudomonadota bacterium]
MKVAIDALSSVLGGGSTYLANMLPAIGRRDTCHEYLVLVPPQGPEIAGSSAMRILRDPRLASGRRRVLFEQLSLPGWLRREHIDVFFSTADTVPLAARGPTVISARNSLLYAPPELRPLLRRYEPRLTLLRALFRASARKADCVVFVSEASRTMAVTYGGIPRAKTRVVHHGLSARFAERGSASPAPLAAPYVLTVCAVNAYKNLGPLVRAFARVAGPDHLLVIAGALQERAYVAEVEADAARAGLGERLRWTGPVPHAELSRWYSHAAAFVFPSLIESFGHPLGEAMACGAPVVSSRIPVAEEICADAVSYFDPSDEDTLTGALARVLSDPAHAASLARRGRARAAEFDWDRSAKALVQVLEDVAAARRARS